MAIIRSGDFHEHGHVAFTLMPKEVFTDKRKKFIHNLMEDVRLELLLTLVFPNMRYKFNYMVEKLLSVPALKSDLKYVSLIQELFAFRLVQHDVHKNTSHGMRSAYVFMVEGARHSDREVNEVLNYFMKALYGYARAFLNYNTLPYISDIEFDSREMKQANSYYVKALKKAFAIIDKEKPPPVEFDKHGGIKSTGSSQVEGEGDEETEDDDFDELEDLEDLEFDEDEETEDDDKTQGKTSEDQDEDQDEDGNHKGAGGSEDEEDHDETCGDEGLEVVELDELEDKLNEKIVEEIKRMDDNMNDPSAYDIAGNMPTVEKHVNPIDSKYYKIGTSMYRMNIPHELSKILADGRRTVMVEKSSVRLDAAPLTGQGKKYLQIKHKEFHFEIELCMDISDSVDSHTMQKQWRIACTLFETFKNIATIRLSAFSNTYNLIDPDAQHMPSATGYRSHPLSRYRGGTMLFESVATAIKEIDPTKTYVFVAITDGAAWVPTVNGMQNYKIARWFLEQIQTLNRFVFAISVEPLGGYMKLFGKYAIQCERMDTSNPLHLQTVIDKFAEMIIELSGD